MLSAFSAYATTRQRTVFGALQEPSLHCRRNVERKLLKQKGDKNSNFYGIH